MSRTILPLVFLMTLCSAAIGATSVYEYAKSQASAAEAFFKQHPPNDGQTLSIRVYADGKAVAYEYVLPFKRNATYEELTAWRVAARNDVIRRGCPTIKATPFFKDGFHFRYRYLNREGKVVDDFLVDKSACEGL